MAKCETCGQEISVFNNKPLTNAMSQYVDAATGKLNGVYNDDVEFLTVGGVKLQRADKYKAKVVAPSPAPGKELVKSVPAAPVKPAVVTPPAVVKEDVQP